MKLGQYIILAVCLLCTHMASAQTGAKAPLTLEPQGDSLLRVSFAMPQLSYHHDEGFLHFDPSMGMNLANGTPGQPSLPTLSTLVRLPKGSTLEVAELRTSNGLELELAPEAPPLAPITRAWAKDSERPPYEPDAKTYATDAFFRNGEVLEVEDLGAMGRWQLFRLTVRPMAYNPARGRLSQYNTLRATLKMHKAPAADDGNVLLVVARPEFQAGLQPFVQWKRQEGYNVHELYVTTHQRDSVKAAIRPWFDNATPLAPAPSYILLVGDAAQIQSFIGQTSLEGESHTTDLPYADHTGDYLPDAMLGRWPVNDTAELRTVVEKTLQYEQFAGIDTAQLERLMLVAGNEQAGQALLTTNSQVEYVGREAKLAHPELDTVTYRNPQSGTLLDSIKADIGRGASLLNYTAHCTVGGWTSPALSIGRVEEAGADQPMVYVNNCCKSNTFSGTGFGEQLLRLPVGGAVAVIGATNSTLWYEDYFWAVGPKWPIAPDNAYDSLLRGAFDALVGSHPSATTVGELLTAGNLAVTAFGSGYSRFYWEVYCLLGDPTLRPYIGVPARTTLGLANGAFNGQDVLHVEGTPGATVTALQGDSLLGVATLNGSGTAAIPLCRTLDTLPLILTASGAGLRPTVDTVEVDRSIARGATLREVTPGDTAVAFAVENTARQPACPPGTDPRRLVGRGMDCSRRHNNIQPAARRTAPPRAAASGRLHRSTAPVARTPVAGHRRPRRAVHARGAPDSAHGLPRPLPACAGSQRARSQTARSRRHLHPCRRCRRPLRLAAPRGRVVAHRRTVRLRRRDPRLHPRRQPLRRTHRVHSPSGPLARAPRLLAGSRQPHRRLRGRP